MKFEKHIPSERLRPFIHYFVVSENELETEYKIFPITGLVIGFQYKGRLKTIQNNIATSLSSAGITGLADTVKTFKNSADIGTILVYFTEIGFAQFSTIPANELFNVSVSLETIFNKSAVSEIEEKLAEAITDNQRIKLVEQFLIRHLKNIHTDKLILEAVRLIYQQKGAIRIKELSEQLFISQSPFEKRFRKLVGTTPKKFASIIRFNAVLDSLGNSKSLTEICYEHNFFDQAHFIKDFKQFTGDTPEKFKR